MDRYDRAGSLFLKLMMYIILYRRETQDWVDHTRLGYDKTGNAITSGYKPQWHHIYPRSVLKKADIPVDDIQAIANITVLNEETNVNKLSGKEPWRYIKKFKITSTQLLKHLVPNSFIDGANVIEERWAITRYDDLLTERAKLLANAANTFLSELAD